MERITAVCIQGKKVDTDRARRLAERFNTELTDRLPEDENAMFFVVDRTGVSFRAAGMELKGDFTRLLPRVTGGHLQHEILLKAAKQDFTDSKTGPRAVDATAGLGEDSFILAAGGYTVEMFEHNPVTAVLLADALNRAKRSSELKDIAARMSLREGDSKELLSGIGYVPDLIYLDPMFPEKKKSAETKKKLQMLHCIEMPCSDENELLQTAMQLKPSRIIIKRPPEGPFLAGIVPTYSVTRKAVRFDCITISRS